MTAFFGERWDAPRVDDATQVATPVGQLCLYCREPIEDGDRGVLTPYVGVNTSGIAPVHIECDLRSTVGDVEHLEGRCICRGTQTLTDVMAKPDRPYRQQARETLAWINARRAHEGMGPM